ncbi:MAG: hypothetical protein IH899_16410 [Planctomycetes bacterium]|nr:hypothetical protein [Planctomycetota bacterium]
MGLAIQVKDSAKLTKSLDTLVKSLPATIGADFVVKKRDYRGTVLHTVHVEKGGFPLAPSYAIHNGWLVVSFYPQTVQGFIYRGDGKHAVWKPPSVANSAIADATRFDPKARITTISVSDPKPMVVQILSLSPFLVKMISSIAGAGSDFDISLIPNAQTVTERLTHNVSIAVDNGKSVRIEGYSSFPMPFQISGLETYVYLFSFSFIGFLF